MIQVPPHTFVLIAPRFDRFAFVVRAAFEHPWVASYQIGFGPPLVRSSPRLIEQLKSARGAFDKLETYAACCLIDRKEQGRLAYLHKHLLVRRHGPMEAEQFALHTIEALDLSLRLHAPSSAPAAVAAEMLAAGVDPSFAEASPPELLSGRFLVRLDDPRGERLLDLPAVAAAVPPIAPQSGEPMALELRVLPEAAGLWRAYVAVLGVASVELA